MKRRTFLTSLAALPGLALVRPKRPERDKWPQLPPFTGVYTDSDGRTPADLSALHDGKRTGNGIEYQA